MLMKQRDWMVSINITLFFKVKVEHGFLFVIILNKVDSYDLTQKLVQR